jgi:SAM-dependent methyltransferase
MLDPDVESFVLGALPATPARVLEVGAGRGELAQALRSAGHEVLAIDPRSEVASVAPVALHQLTEPAASFDAAVAVVSLHHVEPLPESCRRLAELLRPGATLVVDEFDVERLDERATRWCLARRETGGDHDPEPAEVVAEMRHHCHWLRTLRTTLAEWFDLPEPVRGPYLYRWHMPPGLRGLEEDEIAAGRLPATGARLVGLRNAAAAA